MAAQYELLKDFLGLDQSQPLPTNIDSVATNPYWVLAVFRYQEVVTFSRSTMSSVTATPDQGVRLKGGPLVITSDCIQLQVESNKSSFTGGLSAELIGGQINYLSELMPGDWCAAWIFNNEEDAQTVIGKIRSKASANDFMDGLKFLGRLTSVRKSLRVDPSGRKSNFYSIQASSFREFDATLFFDPDLTEEQPGIAQYISKLGRSISDLITGDDNSTTGISINKVMPFLMDLLLGTGIPPSISHASPQALGAAAADTVSPPQTVSGLTTAEGEAPYSYLVPMEVGAIVGKTSSSKKTGILSAADLDEILIGIQQYRSSSNSGSTVLAGTPEFMFNPDIYVDNTYQSVGNRRYTGKPLLGVFLADVPQFTDKNVWTIMNQYLNPAVNEMFTTLRVNEVGAITPTLVIRQIPFSTTALAQYLTNNNLQMELTYFLELPRWNLDPLLVTAEDIGRSDSLRFNFVHLYGQSEVAKLANPMTFQIVLNPPIRDDNDIKRNGLRPLMGTVACGVSDIHNQETKKWMLLTADSHMNMHLVLSGTINCFGIQAPICIGDNLEFDGVVFHIESVLHSCQIEADGRRSFYTTFQLSHGMRSNTGNSNSDAGAQARANLIDQNFFAGIYQTDNTDLDPGLTYDAQTLANGTDGLRANYDVNDANSSAQTNSYTGSR